MTDRLPPDALPSPSDPVGDEMASAIFGAASLLVVVLDHEGRILRFNTACEHATGFRADEVVGTSVWRLVPEDHRTGTEAVFRELRDEGRSNLHENDWKTRDGGRRRVAWSNTVIRNAEGAVQRVIGTGIDITALRAAESERRLSESRLAGIVHSSDDAIVATDPEGRILSWNPAAERIYGLSRGEAEQSDLSALVPPERLEELNALLKKVREGRSVGHLETLGLRRSEERFEVSLGVSPRRDASGRVVGASVIARDLSAYRGLERQLRETEELASIATLITGIAHDIGTPLNVVLGYTQMLARSLGEESDRERLRIVQEQVQRVVRLIQTLVNFARPQKETPLPLDVEALLDEVLGLISETARRRGIAVERDFARGAPIRAKKERLERAFLNLFINAADAMTAGGTLRVATRELGEGVEIRIRDTGTGMDKQTLERIFEPFFTTKQRGHGSGLGLLVTRGIVAEHGGTIDVWSELGQGTEFRIRLPREPAAAGGDAA